MRSATRRPPALQAVLRLLCQLLHSFGRMALISIEDLDGLDDDITDSSEPMDEEEQDRMHTHWQAVGRTHQVSVPREMRGPIEEMTRRNQTSEREPVPSVTISRHEKLGEVLYEERLYPPGKWACVSKADMLYEQSISNAFMKLMRFICKENSTGEHTHTHTSSVLYSGITLEAKPKCRK
uniref:Heme-binding protein soul4 n=1 Tax=Sinocyclocheilus grahami TaxID=75366 RepID=A0A672SU44_SINGR